MAKADKNKKIVEQITEIDLEDLATGNLRIYGAYTLEQRAIPDFRDGLKPVHRMSLWAFKDLGATPRVAYFKAAEVVGKVIGSYHPHGDQGTFDAMVTMANLPEPLIDGQGNWGTPTDVPGAYRYIECRLTEYGEDCLLDPAYLAVSDYVDNYNGKYKVPILLPAKLPNLLLNGSEGIATGASTLIPSFSKDSVVKVVKLALGGKAITAKMCAKYLEFKFAEGGTCVSEDSDILEYFKTGKGSLLFQPSYARESGKITITSLAPRLMTGDIKVRLEKCLTNLSYVDNVVRTQDESDDEGWKLAMYLKKGLTPRETQDTFDEVRNVTTTSLPCQTAITERHATPVKGREVSFRYTNIPTIINDWIPWRVALELKVINHLINKADQELERLSLLQLAAASLPVMKKIMDVDDPVKMLIKELKLNGKKLTEDQANFLINLTFRSLTKLSRTKLAEQVKRIKSEVVELKKDLKAPEARILKSL